MNKKQKKQLGIFFFIAGIILIGYLGFNNTLTIFAEDTYGSASQINTNTRSTSYRIDYQLQDTESYTNANACGTPYEKDFFVYGELPLQSNGDWEDLYSSGIQTNKNFPAKSSELSPVLAVYSRNTKNITANIGTGVISSADCKAVPSPDYQYSNIAPRIQCKVHLIINPIDNLGNILEGDYCYYTPDATGQIFIDIPKQGIECLDDFACSEGYTCNTNNQCEVKTISVYRLSNQTCSVINIPSVQKTDQDFDSLTACQNNILPEDTKQSIGFKEVSATIGVILLFLFLFWAYKRR